MTDAEIDRGRLASRYAAMVAAGDIVSDAAQTDAVARLDRLNQRLAERRLAAKGSALGWLFAGKGAAPIKGLYIHGEVGRGKTMLMDGFFAVAAPRRKRRAHFHAFMAEAHERIHAFRQAPSNGARGGDPIVPVADQIAGETRLLCLDEFMVTDIADAMILSRLFGRLFERGLVLVATSNTAPDDLYRNGLNRDLFLPFVAVLKRHAEVVELRARTDYRLENLAGTPVYVSALQPDAGAALDRIWRRLTGTVRGEPAVIEANGREIRVPEAHDGVARFRFADLGEAPLGAADFLRIARAYHSVIVDGIPVIAAGRRDVARRFINLVDTFYDQGVKLIVSAAAEPGELYSAAEGEEALAFRRTVSRLIEMRSEAWLSGTRRRPAEWRGSKRLVEEAHGLPGAVVRRRRIARDLAEPYPSEPLIEPFAVAPGFGIEGEEGAPDPARRFLGGGHQGGAEPLTPGAPVHQQLGDIGAKGLVLLRRQDQLHGPVESAPRLGREDQVARPARGSQARSPRRSRPWPASSARRN